MKRRGRMCTEEAAPDRSEFLRVGKSFENNYEKAVYAEGAIM